MQRRMFLKLLALLPAPALLNAPPPARAGYTDSNRTPPAVLRLLRRGMAAITYQG